jgi:ATP-dependent Clp protease ATP-binding subunit ClpB
MEMEVAQRASDLAKMSELQYGTIPELERQLSGAAKDAQPESKLVRSSVTDEEIAEVVAKWTNIPVSRMLEGERDKLLRMEDNLHQRVIGQDVAVTSLANAIRRSRAGLADENRPIGAFLFLGPTGVGKTELCKALAEFMFDTEQAMIRIDMSEFMEKHSVARLIGAPPGYVGYEEGGYLTEAVRRKPYAVILLDEVEKAHNDVFNILLQVFDEGRLTDGHGRTIDFRNTILVMTSNLGSEKIQALPDSDYATMQQAVMGEVTKHFRPEFINRIDEAVVFHPLLQENIIDIAKIQLANLQQRLAKHDLKVELTDAALQHIATVGFDPIYGARPLKRVIQQELENPLAQSILQGSLTKESNIEVDVKADKLIFTSNSSPAI